MQYVVIDFEATCDEPFNPDPQEVIEFPAVLVDSEKPDRTAEFHTFVRPAVHSRLTSFCRELTGIRQDQVDGGCSFPEALKQFEEWLRAQCPGEFLIPPVLVVTCGDWDLGSLLPRQCGQHRLSIPTWAERWANLKRLFAWHFPQAADRGGMVEMLEALGLPLVGRLHSGIDDARNIARALRRMLELGVSVVNTAFWRCLGCGSENRHRSRQCERCGRSSVLLREGDWACPRCGFGNFAYREKCYDCGVPRSSGAAAALALKPGDWLCAKCGEHNFARRRACFQCGSVRR